MFEWDKENKDQTKQINKQISEKQMLYKKVFETPEGEEVLKDLAKRSFLKVTTYDSDPIKMGINEGRRSLYYYIENLVRKDLSEILEDLTKEQ